MTNRILLVGLLAGIFAGLITAILQHVLTVPVIIAAERYETAAPAAADADHAAGHVHGAVADDHASADDHDAHALDAHAHDANAWAPTDGFERIGFTTLATVGASVGFAMILIAGMVMTGIAPTLRSGLAFGACLFVAFSLAPAMGLPPELPGMQAAPVMQRQIWWIGTVVATLGGLWLILRVGGVMPIVAGLLLVAVPHLIGAPQAHEAAASAVPAQMSARFAATAMAVAAMMWALIGGSVGAIWQRLDRGTA
jgi:cobalt transporter subunit CbtA